MMTDMSLAFDEEDVYTIELSDSEAPALIQSIIENPGNMLTYNWKENARKMIWWLKKKR